MKLVYSHKSFARVGLVRGLLQNERIPVVTRNEHVSSLGELPALDIELWVADEDFFLAQSVITEFQNTPETTFEDWFCPRCDAKNDGNMGACWNCDWEIDGPENQ